MNIAFGSCYAFKDQITDIFKNIGNIENSNETTPDLFIWGGDAVYLDCYKDEKTNKWRYGELVSNEWIKKIYDTTNSYPYYQEM